ncbi:MAG: sigma-70 family RNA polymerase sigma factor [Planctomycetes bacterium]|nr:sigma-70 family RNA polymerase sigma factor [Planctomycetota bacterium]MCB9891280.1 sigma-70 family RNA polymerase sigma factor [Planctomycetota bacterium]MCB9919461.1 sigma-70 family RNA polymerase sigma factor [Planctomycetota bacterium]
MDPDRELISGCRISGSEDFEAAFSALYKRYKDRVYSIAYRVTGNSDDALDASQEAFVLVYQNLPGFKFESKFSSWLYRLVVNASIDLLRRQKSRTRKTHNVDSESDEMLGIADERQVPPQILLESKELGDQVHASILSLSPKLRVVTVLRYLQNLSYEDVAETLELSLGTVKSRLARAHIALIDQLRPLLDDAAGHPVHDGHTTRSSTPGEQPRLS